MKLAKVMKSAEQRVAGGSEYLWECFGPNARWMEFADNEDREFADAVYDTVNNRVYQINIHIPGGDDRCITWIDPEFEHAYVAEARRRKIEPYGAWDNVMYNTVPGSEEDTILNFLNDAAFCIYDHFPAARYAEKSTRGNEVANDVDVDAGDVGFHKLSEIEVEKQPPVKKYVARFTVEYEVTVEGEDLLSAYDQALFAAQSLYTDEAHIDRTNITKESIEQL